MKLICESSDLQRYLDETEEVDYSSPAIQEKAAEFRSQSRTELELVERVFEFVRDDISHSWDIQSSRITRKASEVLAYREGICYAKSNLLAAFLRCLGIPTGFCYQKLTIGDLPETGYCIHALNAVYLSSLERWIRLDARGNKEGVDAQFSIEEEKLAFPVREHFDEDDYPTIYCKPNEKTMETLKANTNCIDMYLNRLHVEL